MRVALPIVILLGACGGKGSDGGGSGSGSGSAIPAPKPMVVTFGDCGDATTAFVSGPRPLPPYRDEVVGSTDDPPPPEEEEEESGGTGTAMALDEGRMGKKDADRAEGQYKMKRLPDDSSLARQQAIEAARNAGILGQAALEDHVPGVFEATPLYGGTGDTFGKLLGPGDDATGGWGTIGLGKPGQVIGGVGHGPRNAPPVPTVSVGTPNASGDLDKAIIRRYIKRNINKIQYCYEKELLAKPDIQGTVMVQFMIDGSGAVRASNGTGFDKEVASCVAGVIKNIEFPKPKGSSVQVNYPFDFRTGSGSATPAPPPPPPPPPPKPVAKREMHRSPYEPFVDEQYSPGAENPLREQSAALVACFAKSGKPYGVAAVELTGGASPKVYGVDDATATCVAAAAAKVIYLDDPKRCPLAFGDMPLADLATIDITAKAVALGGAEMATLPIDPAKPDQLAKLSAGLHASIDPIVDSAKGPVIAIHGPVVARIADDAKYGDVTRTLATVLAADDDFVITTKRGGAWKQLRPTTFPIIPVAFGTGAAWAPIKARGGQHEPSTKLSIFITKDAVWITGQRQDPMEVKRDAKFAGELKRALEAVRMSPFFDERHDCELGGEDDVTWADLVTLIDAVEAGGFREWALTDRNGLTTLAPALRK